MEINLGAKVLLLVAWTTEQQTECSPYDGAQVAEAARNDDGPMQATSGGDVGASGASRTVPGQVELDPGATPQAQLQKGTAPTTQSPRTEEDGCGVRLCFSMARSFGAHKQFIQEMTETWMCT